MVGTLAILLGLFMLVPMTISIYFREVGFQSFLISAAIAIGLGVLIKKGFSTSKEPTVKESFIIVTLGWITAAAVGALPFLLSGTCPTYTDAFLRLCPVSPLPELQSWETLKPCPKGFCFGGVSYTGWVEWVS